MSSPKRLARIAGLLYLIVGIFGGFAIAYVTAKVYAPSDAATKVAILLHENDLFCVSCDTIVEEYAISMLGDGP